MHGVPRSASRSRSAAPFEWKGERERERRCRGLIEFRRAAFSKCSREREREGEIVFICALWFSVALRPILVVAKSEGERLGFGDFMVIRGSEILLRSGWRGDQGGVSISLGDWCHIGQWCMVY